MNIAVNIRKFNTLITLSLSYHNPKRMKINITRIYVEYSMRLSQVVTKQLNRRGDFDSSFSKCILIVLIRNIYEVFLICTQRIFEWKAVCNERHWRSLFSETIESPTSLFCHPISHAHQLTVSFRLDSGSKSGNEKTARQNEGQSVEC